METIHVTIDKLVFSPADLKAKAGDTVTWIIRDIVAHTATARGDWDVMILANKSARLVLTKAGIVEYYCRFYPNMKGMIAVTPEYSEAGGDLNASCPAEYDCIPNSRYRQPQARSLSVCTGQRH